MTVNAVMFGRLPLEQILRGWRGSATLSLTLLLVVVWWLGYALLLRRHGSALGVGPAVVAAVPLLLSTALPVLAIYLSDQANHYFYFTMVHMNRPRALTLLLILVSATVLLQGAYVERARRGLPFRAALTRWIALAGEPYILLFLAVLGALQSASYVGMLGNDFSRYWAIADAMATGAAYPVALTEPSSIQGGMAPYLIDPPLFPAMLAISFALFGHSVQAAYAPIVASNVLLPPLTYLLFREVIQSRTLALSLAAMVVLFPPLRFYTLNWTVPDATFLALLMACGWMLARVMKGDRNWGTWMLFGLLAAGVALTRLEGPAYAGLYWIAALATRPGKRQSLAASAAFLAPVGAFSLVMMAVFQTPWPHSHSGSLALQNVVGNWNTLSAASLDYFATGIRLSKPELVGYSALLVLLAVVGCHPRLYRPHGLAVLVAPAWFNLLALLMIDPLVSGARLWHDFFRHLSYPFPLVVLAAGLAAQAGVRAIRPRGGRVLGMLVLNLLLFALVLWDVHLLTKPSWNFGADAGNLLGGGRANLVDILANRYPLPVFGFKPVEGHNVPASPADFSSWYPDRITEFFTPFDAVRQTTGTPYQTASLYLYLASLAMALLSTSAGLLTAPSRGFSRRRAGDKPLTNVKNLVGALLARKAPGGDGGVAPEDSQGAR